MWLHSAIAPEPHRFDFDNVFSHYVVFGCNSPSVPLPMIETRDKNWLYCARYNRRANSSNKQHRPHTDTPMRQNFSSERNDHDMTEYYYQ